MDRQELAALLDARQAAARSRLRQAVALDVARFLGSEVEARLRARPYFTSSTPPQALVQLRRRLDEGGADLVAELARELDDLEVWFRGKPVDEAEEAEAIARVLVAVEERCRSVLARYAFPGDRVPDRVGDDEVDLDPQYALRFEPSPAIAWAWRQLRGLWVASSALAGDGPAPDTFDVRFYAPEALPPDRSRRPTLD